MTYNRAKLSLKIQLLPAMSKALCVPDAKKNADVKANSCRQGLETSASLENSNKDGAAVSSQPTGQGTW